MDLKQTITEQADQCVKCGMCLPSCPTYQIFKNESESPRGRIALMQGLVQGQLDLNSKVLSHLDHCTGCLSCENLCPSHVKFEQLLDNTRAFTVLKQPKAKTAQVINFLTNASVQTYLHKLLRLYQLTGLQTLFRSSGILKAVGLQQQEKLLPKLQARLKLKNFYPSNNSANNGAVSLFPGCMGSSFEQNTILASLALLNRLGYDVHIPTTGCCGALHQHSGYPQQAEQHHQANQQALLATKTNAILFTASGCGAQLKSSLATATIPVTSIMDFVQQHLITHGVTFKALNKSIALHHPCSLKNALKQSEPVEELLSQIPSLSITTLEAPCCGAAGKNMLTQTNLANLIRQPLIQQIQSSQPDYVVTSNIGCLLHLSAGLEHSIPAIHPVELLAKSLK